MNSHESGENWPEAPSSGKNWSAPAPSSVVVPASGPATGGLISRPAAGTLAADWLASGAQVWAERLFWPLVAVLVAVASLRVSLTWSILSQTYDEPAHLATGLEWWQAGRYTIEALHPPLARIMMALGPYLDGARTLIPDDQPGHDIFSVGTMALGRFATYWHRLTLARLGTLPFLGLGIVAVALWGRALIGAAGGLIAAALFSMTPAVLAHGGLATTDMASAATFTLATFACYAWIRQPGARRSVALGLAAGAAVGSKFLALVNLPLAGAVILACAWTRRGGRGLSGARFAGLIGLMLATAALFVWSLYRFDIGPVGPGLVSRGLTAPGSYMVPVPAPQFWLGLVDGYLKNQEGFAVYLLGQPLDHAVWYFFPVALFFKTPMAILALGAAGLLAVAGVARRQPVVLIPAGVIAIGLIFLMQARVNLGIRHALHLYPFLALLAAMGLLWLWNLRPAAGRIMAGVLSAGVLVSTVIAHPDYLAFFNFLAGRHPEQVLVDSDLDWGQDMGRLARAMDREPDVWANAEIFDFSMTDLSALTTVPHSQIGYTPAGWRPEGRIALSIDRLQLSHGWDWLRGLRPVGRIGESLLVYDISHAQSFWTLPRRLTQGAPGLTIKADAGFYGPDADDPNGAIYLRKEATLAIDNPTGHSLTLEISGHFIAPDRSAAHLLIEGNGDIMVKAPADGVMAAVRFTVAPGHSEVPLTVQGVESGTDSYNRPYALTIERPSIRLVQP